MPCGVHPIGHWLWGFGPTAFAWYLRHYLIFSAFAYFTMVVHQPVSKIGFKVCARTNHFHLLCIPFSGPITHCQ